MAIEEFRGEYRFLSNFYPCKVKFDGRTWRSAEHAYQAAKTRNPAEKDTIAKCPTSGKAKKAGYRITLREDWEKVKVEIMGQIVRAKFSRHSELQKALLATGEAELTEGNWWGDTFWGKCRGEGENHLGKILTAIRTELRESRSEEMDL